jgi:hypothetical protein
LTIGTPKRAVRSLDHSTLPAREGVRALGSTTLRHLGPAALLNCQQIDKWGALAKFFRLTTDQWTHMRRVASLNTAKRAIEPKAPLLVLAILTTDEPFKPAPRLIRTG